MTEPSVHRILDQAFAGIELTPELQDLKEEMRTNLLARVAELESLGRSPDDAARVAAEEIGDLRAVVVDAADGATEPPAGSWAAQARLASMHKVRPRPAAVAALVVLSSALTATVTLIALGATGAVVMSTVSATLVGLAGALLTCAIVVVALRQETTAHYPVPPARAVGWGAAAAAGVLAVALGATYAGDRTQDGLLAATVGLAVVSIAGLVTLGVTQTNRTKGWVRDAAVQSQDRFSRDPAAAARFGIYSGVVWLAALAAAVAIGLGLGWLWSWTPLVVAVLVEMVLLARMQFPSETRGE
ncbi:permease prefix domain 1-containing protein [Actinotalea sp. M2MS4P-6]|uniref:permease prefix domain 1-containing protein n=1 Tax=Actinotalea sp. M2MS4P-6 TaxID=2983762 RepID=UPI0021E3A817|nr:permease prefix domain 1-containing protein [Actinotalea sp. M2MS4P-6]MCV2393595.1 permease prefix domain 1-containing protein [Actinotalea sp. M2MS4P-6]